MLALK